MEGGGGDRENREGSLLWRKAEKEGAEIRRHQRNSAKEKMEKSRRLGGVCEVSTSSRKITSEKWGKKISMNRERKHMKIEKSKGKKRIGREGGRGRTEKLESTQLFGCEALSPEEERGDEKERKC